MSYSLNDKISYKRHNFLFYDFTTKPDKVKEIYNYIYWHNIHAFKELLFINKCDRYGHNQYNSTVLVHECLQVTKPC